MSNEVKGQNLFNSSLFPSYFQAEFTLNREYLPQHESTHGEYHPQHVHVVWSEVLIDSVLLLLVLAEQ